ncbi:MAG: chorismate synthase [Carnobacterium sp.]|jgi:chorismate synthase|uniref:Chorismate synthase n=3 Tax=Carnobacterium TaxID=2747 RepID=K8E1L0_CARML|nr:MULTISPECIES: chorismate synthase [Carnobacterium]AOA03676.1 chorismate synthase [Carnobacterium maltaromaticum]KRN61931.1 chorismate synthase [Carnobacterium maltaromaticum DSM 20342]KRN72762.1 chorismate synthase [Carnobacterium maltaromaticum]MBC9789801.1 chorismate synthase [Carnobacterium maltaromaticum]MBC9807814.1 chorismate synthase [Carnobacterium maltaromaticum]
MRYLTAGESHGPGLTAIIEGLPAGTPLLTEDINKELARRQAGYGRGGRMKIEKDQAIITAGIRHGEALGSPIALTVENKDWKNWKTVMSIEPIEEEKVGQRRVSKPRPGHADLVGGIKYGHRDLRNILERSSARETTVRVAVGAIAKKLLHELGIEVVGHVVEIGGVQANLKNKYTIDEIREGSENSPVRCLDPEVEQEMMDKIDEAKKKGDTIGGVVEVVVGGVPAGLGSYVQWDKKLDAKIARAIVSINAFKGAEFGVGFDMARKPGSEVMDEILWDENTGYTRGSNNLGGFEGGMTNGMPIVVRGVMKPIPTLYKPLMSVDIDTKEEYKASIERSDSCAVPAASVVAEAVVAWEVAEAVLDKFDGDSFERLKAEVAEYRRYANNF